MHIHYTYGEHQMSKMATIQQSSEGTNLHPRRAWIQGLLLRFSTGQVCIWWSCFLPEWTKEVLIRYSSARLLLLDHGVPDRFSTGRVNLSGEGNFKASWRWLILWTRRTAVLSTTPYTQQTYPLARGVLSRSIQRVKSDCILAFYLVRINYG